MLITSIFITNTNKFCDNVMSVFVLHYHATSINSICRMNNIDIDIDSDIDSDVDIEVV